MAGKVTTTQSTATALLKAGPLPTTTPPPECYDAALFEVSTDASSTTFVRMQLGFLQSGDAGSPCFPSAYVDGVGNNQNPVFSPGSTCPPGYGPSCTLVAPGATYAAATTVEVWESLASGDVAIGCCVRGYTCVSGNRYACASTLTENETITATYLTDMSATTEITADSHTHASLIALKVLYVPEKNAPSGDVTATSAHSNGLSQGQIAAIGVSVPLGVIALLVVGFLLYRRHKRKTGQAVGRDRDVTQTDAYTKPELDALTKVVPRNELDPTSLSELPENESQAHTQPIAELSGDSAGQLAPLTKKPAAINRKPVAGSRPVAVRSQDLTTKVTRKPIGSPT